MPLMRRLIQPLPAFLLLIALTLYGAAPAFSTPPVASSSPVTVEPAAPAPAKPAVASETATTHPEPFSANPMPHIALLLPLDSPSFGAPADAVKQGFLAAAGMQRNSLPVAVYPSDESPEHLLATYRKALAAGAKIVVGPLTRSGTAALAASNLVTVPTLALNVPEGEPQPTPQLYLFGLQAESEARQLARLAYAQGKRNILIVGDETPLARRVRQGFSEEWQKLGGTIASQFNFKPDSEVLLTLREEITKTVADAVLLTVDGRKARLARPYIDNSVVVYATYQVFDGNNETLANFDLNGVRFLDMPWLLQPDHPAAMIYPRPSPDFPADMQRLYAFGIDAFRLAQAMLNPPRDWEIAIDGVTGHITLDRGHQFLRESLPAQFSQGEIMMINEPKQ